MRHKVVISERHKDLLRRIKRLFNDELIYLHFRAVGIMEIRRAYNGSQKNHLIIKRYPKWYPNDRILHELWERDTWSRDYFNDDNDERAKDRLNKMTTVTKQEEAKKLNEATRQEEGRLKY